MKIVTLCGCGLGTCFILKFTAERAARELGIPVEVVPDSISGCGIEGADLYLLPFGLDASGIASSAPVVMIRNVVSTEEVKRAILEQTDRHWKGEG